jgi:hypothetical protein
MIAMVSYVADKRVWVDNNTYEILSNLFNNTRQLISRYDLCNSILDEWVKSGGVTKIGNINFDNYITRSHLMSISVDEEIWNNFIYTCRHRFDMNLGFKLAVYYFIELINLNIEMLMGLR